MSPAVTLRAKFVRASPARRGLLALVGGTGAGQLIALCAAPIVSRIYAPGVYGPFAVINSVAVTAATVAAMRYDLAIPVPEADHDARSLASLGIRIAVVLSAATTVALFLASHWLARILHLAPAVAPLLPWAPVIAGLMGIFIVLNQLAIRRRMYLAIARRNVLQAGAIAVFQVVAGAAGFGAQGLAAGLAAGQAIGVVSLAASLRTDLTESVTSRDRREVARRFKSFPLVMAPSGLINSMGLQVPILLASVMFSSRVAGWLGMTQRILLLPVAMIGVAMSQVFIGEFGAARRSGEGQLAQIFMRASRRLAAVGIIGAVGVMIFAPVAFRLVLGEQWERSGIYAQALALSLVFQTIASPLSQAIIILNKSYRHALWDVARLASVVIAMVAGQAIFQSDIATIWILGGATTLSYVILWYITWRTIQESARPGNGRPLEAL